MRIRGFLFVALALALVAPAAAGADTTIGTTTPPSGSTANPCPASPGQLLIDVDSEGGGVSGPLSVPASSSPVAVTNWTVNAAGVTANQQMTLVVLRVVVSGSTPTITVVGTDSETVTPPASAEGDIESFDVAEPIQVETGDVVSEYAPDGATGVSCYWSGGSSPDDMVEGLPLDSTPVTGEQLNPADGGGGGIDASNSVLNLSATLGPVNYDAALTLTAGPASATTGQPAVITGTVTNDGPLSGPITFTDPVPSGLTVNAVGIGSGTCSTNTAVDIVTCTTDGLAAHQSTPVVIAVTPTAAGTYKDSATVSLSGAGADPNLANNSASATLTVTKAGTPTQCVVPKLKGAPLALGKKVLPLLGCKVGKVKKSTSKSVAKGDVISTSPGAGSYAASKSIGITVSSGKPKPKPKKKKK